MGIAANLITACGKCSDGLILRLYNSTQPQDMGLTTAFHHQLQQPITKVRRVLAGPSIQHNSERSFRKLGDLVGRQHIAVVDVEAPLRQLRLKHQRAHQQNQERDQSCRQGPRAQGLLASGIRRPQLGHGMIQYTPIKVMAT